MTVSEWVEDGEKFAVVALSLQVSGEVRSGAVGPDQWLLASTSFALPGDWSNWLGTIRAGQLEDANVFLLAKAKSSCIDVVDAEDQHLEALVWNFFVGLILASRFAAGHHALLLSGSKRDGELNLRRHSKLEAPLPCAFRGYPEVSASSVAQAARLAQAVASIPLARLPGGHWRLFRVLGVYIKARSTPDQLERLHQYCRCIEGLVAAETGQTKSRFKSRTELFVGPQHHALLGDIYDVRSAVEHLHEDRYLQPAVRETRLNLLTYEAAIEDVARRVIERIVGTSHLWPHFANRDVIHSFWSLPSQERQRLWGSPFDLHTALSTFDPQTIHNGMLGIS